MKNLIILVIIIIVLFALGCSKSGLHVERDGVIIDIDIGYIMQDKQFKSLKYDTKTGVIKIEKFSSETSEVVADIVELITTLK